MAYAAVISLKLTIHRLIESSQIPIPPPSPQIIQLAYENVKSLQQVFTLEDGSNNERVKAVEREIREAACRLEDVLEQAHLSNHHFLSHSHETLHGDFSMQVKEEIIFFTETVKKIMEQLGNASLPEEEDDGVVSSRIDQYFGLTKQRIIGLARELVWFKYYLTDYPYQDPERLVVIAVEGMAGIGKTTLVSGVYLDPFVVSHFKCRAFVSIGSTKYQLRRILLCIIAQINPRFDISRDVEFSDDEELSRSFPDDRNKSRVIVTSRLYNVANHASTTYPHTMQFLDEEESWHLLREKVFGGEENSCPPQLEKAGREIAQKCQGLPLMIIALAKHLSQAKKTAEYWEKVAEKEHWDILAADEEMFEVLAPSYHHLPQHLKACFLYIGIIPQDYDIPASKLIKLWCSEGFLESNTTQELEHFAAECLDRLEDANVVMLCDFRFSSFALTKTCKLHSAFLHLCMREAGQDKFFLVINSRGKQGIESQRRFSIHNNALFGIKDVRELMASVPNVRSLLCTGPHHPYPVPICLGCFSLLRVLDALTVRFYGFPIEAVELVQLRYLAFTYNGKLPASVSKLQNLHYLIVRQYLSILSSESHRWYLPMKIWNMQELRHLEVIGSDLPDPTSDTACLPNLSTLLGTSARSCTKEILARIPNLKKLGIQIRLAVDDADVEPLSCFDCLDDLDQLTSLKCCLVNPNRGVQAVVSTTAPCVPIFPSNIIKLTLSGFEFPREYVSVIAKLPNLVVLKLRCCAFQGQDWTTYEGEFLKLTFLLLEDIDLRYWTAHHSECFPNLQFLFIRHCYKLRRVPPRVGYNSSFLRMKLVDCSPCLVAFTKEEIMEKEEHVSRHIEIIVESSANDGSQTMTNAPGKFFYFQFSVYQENSCLDQI
ncbi:UNVERIFIED_CONTAM: Disease resistance protein RPP13 [Sesamum angustifolium]|uniref:Disease resistance protein RPP13 n=1 Tax=Sesamum angustifolium TaxID=2727405 RepID=A0AAW2QAD4_9LAMI